MEWLSPSEVARFVDEDLHRRPCAGAGTARSVVPRLDWETFGKVLGSRPTPDVLTVSRGRLVTLPRPSSLADLRAAVDHGVSVVVRGSERHDAGLGELAASFGAHLPGEVHVQLYATPGQTNSYGWHYDFEDVFIVQTAGIKDYYFRDNTVARHTVLGDELDFSLVRAETSPLFHSRLLPGDWLYLPPRWWHLVTCVETSLSISVGVMGPEAFRTARRIPAGWTGEAACRTPGRLEDDVMATDSKNGSSLRPPRHDPKEESWKTAPSRETTHDEGEDARLGHARKPMENAPAGAPATKREED
jgi:hypothetical protein